MVRAVTCISRVTPVGRFSTIRPRAGSSNEMTKVPQVRLGARQVPPRRDHLSGVLCVRSFGYNVLIRM